MFDQVFGLPIPSVNAVAPTTVSHGATAFFGVVACLAFLYGLKHWRDTGRPVLLLILVGGGMCTLAEPLVDLMGACWHPNIGQPVAFEFMGRYMPWWIVAVYFAYWGAQGGLLYWLMQRGMTMKTMRWLILIPIVGDILIEELALPSGLYIYDGQQPLILLNSLPFWWVPCNSIGLLLAIALVSVCAPHLKGLKLLLIPLLLPMGQLMGYVAVGLPSFVVINTAGVPNAIVQAGGIATWLLGLLVFHAISLVIATDSPLRRGNLLELYYGAK